MSTWRLEAPADKEKPVEKAALGKLPYRTTPGTESKKKTSLSFLVLEITSDFYCLPRYSAATPPPPLSPLCEQSHSAQ